MISVKVNKADPTDLYEQVAAEIRRAIADGEAKPGERLPPAKDLAAVLGVNTNTVLRSLRLLRDEGLLEFRRGAASRLRGRPSGCGRPASEGACRVRPPSGLPSGRAGRDHRERRLTKTRAQPPKYHGATLGPPDPPRWAEIRKATIRPKRLRRAGIDLGRSRPDLGSGPELRICGRRFDSSRHAVSPAQSSA